MLVAGFDEPAGSGRSSPGTHGASVRESGTSDLESIGSGQVPELEVTQVEYASTDGTGIRMFLIHRADVEPGPDTPTILNGYGGFAITETPVWSPTDRGVVRSGRPVRDRRTAGWRRARRGSGTTPGDGRTSRTCSTTSTPPPTGWSPPAVTSRDRLAIAGRSNGGLLVGAALTQRPDLCRAVWCAVPLLDMIRFPKFLIARLWTDEYGDPDVDEEFAWLHAYSPYHHVERGHRAIRRVL